MRSMEYLIQLYPNKTGKELLAIQQQDRLEDEAKFRKANKRKLNFIEDVNKNGGYFKGTFGLEQRYFYRVFDCVMDGNDMYGSVEVLVMHVGRKNGILGEGAISLERRISTYQQLEKYGFTSGLCQRVTKEQWDEVNAYVDAISKFWALAE